MMALCSKHTFLQYHSWYMNDFKYNAPISPLPKAFTFEKFPKVTKSSYISWIIISISFCVMKLHLTFDLHYVKESADYLVAWYGYLSCLTFDLHNIKESADYLVTGYGYLSCLTFDLHNIKESADYLVTRYGYLSCFTFDLHNIKESADYLVNGYGYLSC